VRNPLLETIVSKKEKIRNRTIEELLAGRSPELLLNDLKDLEVFRRNSDDIYYQVRAYFYSFAICRFYLLNPAASSRPGTVTAQTAGKFASGDFNAALRLLHRNLVKNSSPARLSMIAAGAYRQAFSLLLKQVKRSISESRGNEWLFTTASLKEYPLRVEPLYLKKDPETGRYPLGVDFSPVRMDPCHSGWSDIFFLAMDFPEGARVVNLSVDIAPRGKRRPSPPIECYSRVIEQPIIRLASRDLGCQLSIRNLHELFDFNADHLSLLKAGIIASGIIPPAMEGSHISLSKLLGRLLGPGLGIEIVTRVRDIPPGSRMAVSTTLLNTIITRLMRMTGQLTNAEGGLSDGERLLITGRTILGEWMGGSGGGWQDSGGLWPGIKILEGVRKKQTRENNERGQLLPQVTTIPQTALPSNIETTLGNGIVLFHGGQSRDVGPTLEMVTEKYLLRYRREWSARRRELSFYRGIVHALKQGDIGELGRLTTLDWEQGIKQIIPFATDPFTEQLIEITRKRWGKLWRGFLMLGGAAGGGMAFIVDPACHEQFSDDLLVQTRKLQRQFHQALPFSMKPVVFDFSLNKTGTRGELRRGSKAKIPGAAKKKSITPLTRQKEAETFGKRYGYNPYRQRLLTKQYRENSIGTHKNRLPDSTSLSNIRQSDLLRLPPCGSTEISLTRRAGEKALAGGEVAVVTFAGGLGSRWTGGWGGVKALNPFVSIGGSHRSFLEIHLAKSELARRNGVPLCHIFTTSFLTHGPIARGIRDNLKFGFSGNILLSRTPSLSRRMVPTARDLKAAWKKKLAAITDPKAYKHETDRLERLIQLAGKRIEAANYSSNTPQNLFNPPGHWYELPGLIRNGTLRRLLRKNPALRFIMAHNLDTIASTLDPDLLGLHLKSGSVITFEVTPKWWGDRGGFLARVNGKVRLVEAMALPRETNHLRLEYYNSLSCWLSIDPFLSFLGLTREDILGSGSDRKKQQKIEKTLREVEELLPTYISLKEVKEPWGRGQSDVFPVAQAEKLWGDITGLRDINCAYIPVSRRRAQQLKDPSVLDHWIRDGSLENLAGLCSFSSR